MRRYAIAILLIFISSIFGCGMSNEDIIKAVEYCKSNNMDCKYLISDQTKIVKRVICIPVKSKCDPCVCTPIKCGSDKKSEINFDE